MHSCNLIYIMNFRLVKKRKIVENMNKVMRKLLYEKYISLTEPLYRELNTILILKNKKRFLHYSLCGRLVIIKYLLIWK